MRESCARSVLRSLTSCVDVYIMAEANVSCYPGRSSGKSLACELQNKFGDVELFSWETCSSSDKEDQERRYKYIAENIFIQCAW